MTETNRIASFAEEQLQTGVKRNDIMPTQNPIKGVKWLFPDKSIIIVDQKGNFQAINEIEFNNPYFATEDLKFRLTMKEIQSLEKAWKMISISDEEENLLKDAFNFIKNKIEGNGNLNVEEINIVDKMQGLVGDTKCAIDVQYPYRLNIPVDNLNYIYGFQCNIRFKCTNDQYTRELYSDIEDILSEYLDHLNDIYNISDYNKDINPYDELEAVDIHRNTESLTVDYWIKVKIRKKTQC